MAENNLSGTEIGAGTAKSLDVPQLSPVFSYKSGESLILVYLFKTQATTVAVISLDDGYSEEAYGVSVIHSANTAHSLVWDAADSFHRIAPDTPNPFVALAEDEQALGELNNMLARIFYQGE